MQIDELLSKLDQKDGELARQIEEKEQELLIMQEGMDSTLKELGDLRLVSDYLTVRCTCVLTRRHPETPPTHSMHRSTLSFSTTEKSSMQSSIPSSRLVSKKSTMQCTNWKHLCKLETRPLRQNTLFQ
jgi:hypothetical protein